MTNKVDEYNQIIIEKKEQVNELLNEKKQINGWLDDFMILQLQQQDYIVT